MPVQSTLLQYTILLSPLEGEYFGIELVSETAIARGFLEGVGGNIRV
jgi:hypothetical protein